MHVLHCTRRPTSLPFGAGVAARSSSDTGRCRARRLLTCPPGDIDSMTSSSFPLPIKRARPGDFLLFALTVSGGPADSFFALSRSLFVPAVESYPLSSPD